MNVLKNYKKNLLILSIMRVVKLFYNKKLLTKPSSSVARYTCKILSGSVRIIFFNLIIKLKIELSDLVL